MVLAFALRRRGRHFEIWDVRARLKKKYIFVDFYALWASFSSDRRYIICLNADTMHVEILEVYTGETVYKKSGTGLQMTVQEAKDNIRQCGPMASKLWTFPFERQELNICSVQRSCSSLHVDNILNFVPQDESFKFVAQYRESEFVKLIGDRLQIFKLEWNAPTK